MTIAPLAGDDSTFILAAREGIRSVVIEEVRYATFAFLNSVRQTDQHTEVMIAFSAPQAFDLVFHKVVGVAAGAAASEEYVKSALPCFQRPIEIPPGFNPSPIASAAGSVGNNVVGDIRAPILDTQPGEGFVIQGGDGSAT